MNLSWTYLGRLSHCPNFDYGCVYLLVHHGLYNRVVYVGTTNNLGRRMLQHLHGYLRGNRSVWKISETEDIYTLMSTWHLSSDLAHFKKLAEADLVWANTTIEQLDPKNLLAAEKVFDEPWQQFVKSSYLPAIGVWVLKLDPYLPKMAVSIESAIQQRLVKLFELGYMFNHKQLSILGKIEFNNSLIRVKHAFENVPDVDDASQIIFKSLGDKIIPSEAKDKAAQQLSEVISRRWHDKLAQQKKRQISLERYPNSGKKWELVDLEKLRVMLMDFNMSALEIAPILGRKPSTIKKKIKRNDKFTFRKWRKSISELG
ncbi:GIY-YIG nuclease family protein [Undibacterium sp. B2R-29]|nr:GIY-YIG nuclease family protein [Undibacterium crateris]